MKFKYVFANETVEIEVSEEWNNILIDLDRQEYNNTHAETRRHWSLEALNLDDTFIPSDVDLEGDVLGPDENDAVMSALRKLKPAQSDLLKAIYIEGITVNEYAERNGVTQSAISHRLQTAKNNFQKFFQNPHI